MIFDAKCNIIFGPLFASKRTGEFVQRLNVKTYIERYTRCTVVLNVCAYTFINKVILQKQIINRFTTNDKNIKNFIMYKK